MDEKQLQALANELAKNLKTPEDLSQFDRLLKKISVEAALNAEMSHHLGYDSLAGKVQVKWGEEENAHCVANYQLPPESQQQLLTQLSAECR